MSLSVTRPIVILGEDGCLGWPLSLYLAQANPSTPIILIDNLLRRRLMKQLGSTSLMPILDTAQRLRTGRGLLGLENMRFVRVDVNSKALAALVRERKLVAVYNNRIRSRFFPPKTVWNGAQSAKRERVVVSFAAARPRPVKRKVSSNEGAWETFRQDHFPHRHINLNPGTLGSPAREVSEAMRDFHSDDRVAHPLVQYRNGRDVVVRAMATAKKLWRTEAHALHITPGATACSSLLALSLARLADRLGWPLRVLTTAHEHIGGLRAFERLPEFHVRRLTVREMRDRDAFRCQVSRYYPDIVLFSHAAYDSGCILPVNQWASDIKTLCPHAWTLADISQSLGLLPPPFEHMDVLFASGHKWLFGPRGTGLLWTNERFRRAVGRLNWSGEPLLTDHDQAGFALAGAMDFAVFAGLNAALDLHALVGGDDIARERSVQLCGFFRHKLSTLLQRLGIQHQYLDASIGRRGKTGVLTVSFPSFDPHPLCQQLDQRGVHAKCIKDCAHSERPRRLLRFGFPYYENEQRLTHALTIMETCLQECREHGGTRIVTL